MNKPLITIGIPAYNEAANIGKLLADIAAQRLDTYTIGEIIVYSDGSTDDTVRIASEFTAIPVKVIHHERRQGKAFALNTICAEASGSALVMLDADISIADSLTISNLIAPIVSGEADLCGANIEEIDPVNTLQKVLKASMDYKRAIFASQHNGNNVFTCHGRCRAFSRNLFTAIRFIDSSNEDAYSYLYCVKNGYRYMFVPTAKVLYSLPATLADHESQSIRFFHSRHASDSQFGAKFVSDAYTLPIYSSVMKLITHTVRNRYMFLYLALSLYTSLKSTIQSRDIHIWKVATSSKNICKEAIL